MVLEWIVSLYLYLFFFFFFLLMNNDSVNFNIYGATYDVVILLRFHILYYHKSQSIISAFLLSCTIDYKTYLFQCPLKEVSLKHYTIIYFLLCYFTFTNPVDIFCYFLLCVIRYQTGLPLLV